MYLHNLSKHPFWSHMEFSIICLFRQNLYNIYFQAINTSNIHKSPNLSQITIFDSKIHLNHAWSWNLRLWPTQVCIQNIINRYTKIIHNLIYMFHTKNYNNKLSKLRFILFNFQLIWSHSNSSPLTSNFTKLDKDCIILIILII